MTFHDFHGRRHEANEVADEGTTVDVVRADGRGKVTVTAGRLDEQAVIAFNVGQCHALAWAVHEMTAWPVAAVSVTNGEFGIIGHLMVSTPDGRLLDVNGITSTEAVKDRYSKGTWAAAIEILEEERVASFMRSTGVGSFMAPELPLARSMVAPLLRSVGLTAEANSAQRMVDRASPSASLSDRATFA